MESELIKLGIETFKLSLYLGLPTLLTGMLIGLIVSIFQATTQINETTLSFIPKIIGVIVVLILTMPWMLNITIEFSEQTFNYIPEFVK